MKKLAVICLSLLCVSAFAQDQYDNVPWQEIKLDYSKLTEANHPRLFLSDAEFKDLKKQTKKITFLNALHTRMMDAANASLEKPMPVYKKDASGRRILAVSRDVFLRIASMSYAYRFTGNKTYLVKVEEVINTVCDFDDWNPDHFLDPSEMSLGVSVGYDWLYRDLKESTKAKVRECLANYAMEEAVHGRAQHIFKRAGNWNQVCNAGMTGAAIATYEYNPELSREVITRGIKSNLKAARDIYRANGAFPEGPGYWSYGTCYQAYLIMLWEGAFGTDFGAGNMEGFSNTGWYEAFCRSGDGHVFNYSDNSDILGIQPGLWYIAAKFNCPGILCDEIQFLSTDKYSKEVRILVAMIGAYRLGNVKIERPAERLYVSKGTNDILIAKTGWDKDGLYLGLKGGRANLGHSHMDAGSFVFDAYGTRWASDYYRRNYTDMEIGFTSLGLKPEQRGFAQDSYRWYLFNQSPYTHNTMVINDHRHRADGYASIVEEWDTPENIGGKLDLSAVFAEDLAKAFRSASIKDNSYLEIVDELEVPEGRPAHIRWTLICINKPTVLEDGISFTKNGVTMVLRTDAPGAKFRTWSNDPKDYDIPTASFDRKLRNAWICGFEYDLPAGPATITTTLKKL